MNALVLTILILCAAGAAGSALYWYAFRFEPVNFKLSEIDIFVTDNNEISQDKVKNDPLLTILHLSDFHLRKDRKGDKLFHFIHGLKVLIPDLVLITGDLVEKDEYFPYLKEMLSGLNARLGKYSVFGVHDYYDKTVREFTRNMIRRKKEYRRENDVSGLIKNLDSIGIKVLRNEAAILNLKSLSNPEAERAKNSHSGNDGHVLSRIDEVQLVGLEDAIIEKTDIDTAFQDLADGFQKKNNVNDCNYEMAGERDTDYFKLNKEKVHKLNNRGKIRVIITHTPDMELIAELTKRGADIILCGHTHGGQVRLPGVGALITGSKIKAKYASGLFYFRDFVLYTSRGLGEGRYSPFRFFCQPEASLIRIHNC
jgi:predicted MPP superfamily phosphohydrolase